MDSPHRSLFVVLLHFLLQAVLPRLVLVQVLRVRLRLRRRVLLQVRQRGERGGGGQRVQAGRVHHADVARDVVAAGGSVGAVRAAVGLFDRVGGGQVASEHVLPVGALEPLPAQRTHDGPVPLQHTMLSAPDHHRPLNTTSKLQPGPPQTTVCLLACQPACLSV